MRGAGALLLALALAACGKSDVTESCNTQIDATVTGRDVYDSVAKCLKDGVAEDAIRDRLKLRSKKLLADGKVGAFAAALPPEPDVVEGVHENVRRYSIRSLLPVAGQKPRVLHLGFEFTDTKPSNIVFDLNERQDPDTKPDELPKPTK